MNTLVWLQRELRIQHHPALEAALEESDKVIVAYFHDPEHCIGAANNAWLAHSLMALSKQFSALDGSLWLIEGAFKENLETLIQEYDIDRILYTYQLGNPFQTLQHLALEVCQNLQIKLQPFETENLMPFGALLNQAHQPYKVFTPFYKKLQTYFPQLEAFSPPLKDLSKTALIALPQQYANLPQHLKHLAEKPWAERMMQYWQPGENAAWLKLDKFVHNHIADYPTARDLPNQQGTSQLSPHLHFGEIHSRAILFELLPLIEASPKNTKAISAWIRQLGWREFARYILWHFPETQTQPFQAKFIGFFSSAQQQGSKALQNYQAWCAGETGIPIIDAGMRQLWQTGWMHNRVRMLVASWLTKNAGIDWQDGLTWFNHTLVDADPANNIMGWQWVAGCGVDAAPYYRLFNPIRQSEKFDAQGHYLRQWLPEIRGLSMTEIHAPFEHSVNEKCHYPLPTIDLKNSRQRHLQKVAELKFKSSDDKTLTKIDPSIGFQ